MADPENAARPAYPSRRLAQWRRRQKRSFGASIKCKLIYGDVATPNKLTLADHACAFGWRGPMPA
jgi:hypothetical protein